MTVMSFPGRLRDRPFPVGLRRNGSRWWGRWWPGTLPRTKAFSGNFSQLDREKGKWLSREEWLRLPEERVEIRKKGDVFRRGRVRARSEASRDAAVPLSCSGRCRQCPAHFPSSPPGHSALLSNCNSITAPDIYFQYGSKYVSEYLPRKRGGSPQNRLVPF